MPKFSITYEIVTPESAEHGEADESGFVYQDISLRDAWESVRNMGGCGHCEASDSHIPSARWLNLYGIDEDYSTGATTDWAIHIPDSVTPASRVRIARLFRAYGVK